MPSGSTARALDQNYMDPTRDNYRNVLAGQVVALTLSVEFDRYEAGFGASSTLLGNAIITQSGAFYGMTVNQVLALANQALGGCTTTYSFSQLNDIISAINEAYDGGRTSSLLRCCNLTIASTSVVTVQPTCTVRTGSVTIHNLGGGTATLSGGGLASPITNSTGVFTGLAAGTYSLTRSHSGCTSPAVSVTINAAPAIPVIVAANVATVQPGCIVRTGSVTLHNLAGGTATLSGGGLASAMTSTTGSFSGLAAGSYNLTWTSTAGCVSAAYGVVISPAPAIPVIAAANVVIVQTTCEVRTGSVTLHNLAGGTVTLGGLSAPVSNTTGVFTGLAPGNYSLTLTNTAGCMSAPFTFSINVRPTLPVIPAASVVVVQTSCTSSTGSITLHNLDGGTATLNGGSLSAPVTNSTGIFTGLAAGTYSLTRTLNGCTSAAFSVTINPAPAASVVLVNNVVIVQPTCAVRTGTVTLHNLAGGTATLSGGGLSAPVSNTTGAFANLAPGSYSLTLTNTAGCVSAAYSVTINAAPATPVIVAANVAIVQPGCIVRTGSVTLHNLAGGTATISGGGLASAMTSTTGSFSGLAAGSYNLTLSNAAGCVSAAFAVVINEAPVIPNILGAIVEIVQPTCTVRTGSISLTNLRNNATATLSGGGLSAPLSNTTGLFTGLAPGSYSLTITSAISGCVSDARVVVINAAPAIPAAPVVSVSAATCTAGSVATITSPTASLTFSLDGSSTFAAYPAGGYANLSAGPHTITARNEAGCVSAAASFTIVGPFGLPVAPAICVSASTCSASSVVTINSSTTGLTFSLDGSTTFTAYPVGGFTGLSAGAHSLTVRNAAGCTSAAACFTVQGPSATLDVPVVSVSAATCTAGSVATITSSTAGLTFSLDGSATFVAYPAGGFANLSAGPHTITARNAAGCTSAAVSFTIAGPLGVPAAPLGIVTQPTCTAAGFITLHNVVIGSTYTLTGTSPVRAAVRLTPTSTGGVISNNVFALLPTGAYNLTVTNAAGCTSAPLALTVNPAPAASAITAANVSVVQPNCFHHTGSLTLNTTGLGAGTFTVRGPSPSTAVVTNLTSLAPGTYSVTFTTAAGCVSPAYSVTINAAPAASVVLAANVATVQPSCTVRAGSITLHNLAGGMATLSGSGLSAPVSNTTGVFTSLASGNYSLTLTNAAGCVSAPYVVFINGVPAIPTAPAGTVVQPSCTMAMGTVNVTSPTAGYAYYLTGTNPVRATVSNTTGIFTNVAPGVYSLTRVNIAGSSPGCPSLALR
ncbi:beta strand repeat-containing protein [Hymenobacter humi]|uniref:Beta strand repeat-containing protein n=1 Tax=Hymenobacter humi TaxID=1411620 RepID=A0ABW2U9V5_9BACT